MFVVVMLVYIALATGLTQFYKLTTRTMENPAAQTVGLLLIAGAVNLIFLPFFEFRLSSNPWTYFFLILSCIFFALNCYMVSSVRKNLEASAVGIVQQIYTVLMTLAGFIIYSEEVTLFKILGIVLIIGGNVLVFWQYNKTKQGKYFWLGILAYACNTVAGLIDVGCSGKFSLPLYTALIYIIPAILIFVVKRVRVRDVAEEFKRANRRDYVLTGLCWGSQYFTLLVAYSMEEVSVVAPLASLAVFSNVVAGYFWLKEKERISTKIAAAVLAVLGIVFISLGT